MGSPCVIRGVHGEQATNPYGLVGGLRALHFGRHGSQMVSVGMATVATHRQTPRGI